MYTLWWNRKLKKNTLKSFQYQNILLMDILISIKIYNKLNLQIVFQINQILFEVKELNRQDLIKL